MGKSKSSHNRYYISAESLQRWKYHLPLYTIERGTRYQRQRDSWDCGPNSSARALDMWSKISLNFRNYDGFKNNCPKSFGKPQSPSGRVMSNFLGFFTFGLTKVIEEFIPDVGPSPGELSDYITECLCGEGRGIHSGSTYFDTALDEIKRDLDNNDPVIALLATDPTSMHYINVVAVSEDDDVAILDTTNELYYYSRYAFDDLLDCSSYIPHNFVLSDYNLIRFEKY